MQYLFSYHQTKLANMKTTIFILLLFGASIGAKETNIQSHFKVQDLHDDWWQTAVLYQIYPRSFKDTDGDGNGDLKGISQKLDYLKDLGITGIWLSPIYKSPQVDNGYDISDFRDVDPMYGTLEDLKQIVDEAHKRGLKVILDYVPNHTSDKHAWFQASLQKDPKYDEYYIWKNATYVNGERRPPNNWLSAFRGSAWEWSEERQQYYLHQFSSGQPDINYRNPKLVQEMKDVLTFWMDFGIDGFRMDAIFTLVEDDQFRDEPKSGVTDDPENPEYLSHIYTANLNETFDIVYQFREVLDKYNEEHEGDTRIMVTEVYADIDNTMRYYVNQDHTRNGAHFTFNFITFILYTIKGFSAADLYENIWVWMTNVPMGYTSNWVLGNHDQPRVATRLGVENIDALNILVALLPGAQVTYQGEEIGQENGEVTCEQGYDPQAIKNCSTFAETSRDFERTPFQWDDTKNAGFSDNDTTWLPVSKKYVETNVKKENQSDSNTHYNIYKSLVELRKHFRKTNTEITTIGYYPDSNIFYCLRYVGSAKYAIIFNVNDAEQILPDDFLRNTNLTVVVRSSNSEYSIGDAFNVSQPLRAREAVVIEVTDL